MLRKTRSKTKGPNRGGSEVSTHYNSTALSQNGRKAIRRQFWGGLALGILLGIIIIPAIQFFVMRHTFAAATNTSVNKGIVVIRIDDALLTTGMRMAVQREQSKLPVTLQNVTAVTHQGNQLDMEADVPLPLGLTGNLTATFSPYINNGNLNFHVTQIEGLTLPQPISSALESILNDQFSGIGSGAIGMGLSYQLIDVHTEQGALIVTAKVVQGKAA
jgi:hypothetical protein